MKIIASDYDGTLNHGGIDDIKRDAIRQWRRAGNLFGIVSGRSADDLLEIPRRNNFEYDFLIASNGAVILGSSGQPEWESRCDGALAMPLLEFIFSLGCTWASIHTETRLIIDLDDNERLEDEFTLGTLPEIRYFNQISTILPDESLAQKVTDAIRERFGKVLNPLQNGRCVDVVSADMNKAVGLYKFLEIIGAQSENLITVGDNINDMHMIAEFRSYAMENAVQSIKDTADCEIAGITELIFKEM
ncbi:MAG: HAD hydrolase family protein [Clostridia bacterium]|nr:HAD hydrolase family protein [Clostridia bacterium]